MKKIFAAVFAVVMFFAESVSAYAPDGHLYVTMIDVGQGDSFLVETPTQNILIDTGDTDSNIANKLQDIGIEHLEKIVLTHPHADHIGSISGVLDNFDVDLIYDNGRDSNSPFAKKYRSSSVPVTNLKTGDVLDLGGGVQMKILNPSPLNDFKKNNDSSIVGQLIFGDFSMLFTGDIERDAEDYLVKNFGAKLKSNVLKAPHHGSKTSSSANFIVNVNPDFVLIPAGRDNKFGHPHKQSLATYRENFILPTNILCTAFNGNVRLESDGKNFSILVENDVDWVVDFSGELISVTRL